MNKLAIGTAFLAGALVSAIPVNTLAHEAGDLLLRLGAVSVDPDESSSTVSTTATGALAGTSVGVDASTQLGLNLVYMMSDNIGLEVLAATPFEHDLSVAGLDQYGFSTTDLGSTKQLPPTVSALYFFGNSSSTLRPYIGAGINYTTFFSSDLSSSAETELAAHGLDLDDSFGVSWRAGFDYELSDDWVLNASVWNIDIDTDASFDSALGKVKASVDIDPWVYMISLGFRF
jgi:outer membrane protein